MDRQPWAWRLVPMRCIRCGARTALTFCERCLDLLDTAVRRGDLAAVEQWAGEFPPLGERELALPAGDLVGDRADKGTPAERPQTKGEA
jgi:hypothetical protein